MAFSAADYQQMLAGLMPQGPAWPTEPGTETALTLAGLAQELARLDARIDRLIEEADPRTALELLADWERLTGLPTPCMAGQAQNLDQRRAAVVAQLTGLGGQRPADYIALAAALGYTITITEFFPLSWGMTWGAAWAGVDWAYGWQINAPQTTRTFAQFGVNGWGDRWSAWGNLLLECVIRPRIPAHTIILFTYT